MWLCEVRKRVLWRALRSVPACSSWGRSTQQAASLWVLSVSGSLLKNTLHQHKVPSYSGSRPGPLSPALSTHLSYDDGSAVDGDGGTADGGKCDGADGIKVIYVGVRYMCGDGG